MTAVWGVNLPDSEKIVLLALADAANDEGVCWPSMSSLAAKCSKSDRTVQAAIKALVTAGHLTRLERPGKGVLYTVHPRSDCAPQRLRPAEVSPPKGTTPTPEAASDKPSRTIIEEEEDATAMPVGPEGVFAAWNAMAADCKARGADKLTEKRRTALRARIEDYTEDVVLAAIAVVPRKPWLMGENDRHWVADLDFFLRPDSITRIREGKYDHGFRARPANDSASSPASAIFAARRRLGLDG